MSTITSLISSGIFKTRFFFHRKVVYPFNNMCTCILHMIHLLVKQFPKHIDNVFFLCTYQLLLFRLSISRCLLFVFYTLLLMHLLVGRYVHMCQCRLLISCWEYSLTPERRTILECLADLNV